MSFLTACAATVVCGVLALPALAADIDPSGQWQVTTGESRYRVAHCGKAGDELCAKLTWLREDARTEENMALLNKTIVRGAPADENKWTGTVVYDGQTYDATVTITSTDSMRVHSCSGMFCKSFELSRL
ncbi:MAG: DUF2147 domain-containing protein [Hyphomicrobiales bacterium]|nr:MAG: DUF2147 domain-containing protein [Hyphomicrobiales bacterium]